MSKIFRNNGLSTVLFFLFFFSLIGQYFTGHTKNINDGRQSHGKAAVGYVEYLSGGHFIEVTFENWESEFLQMGMYVVLTIFLFQKARPNRNRLTRRIRKPEPIKGD